MFIPEINYEEVFGVKLSAEPEVAEPEEAKTPEGDKEPETIDEIDAEPDELDQDEEETPSEPDEKPKQSAEENARYAAARRKAEAERDAAVAEAKQAAEKQMDSLIASLGLKDPESGSAITTKQQYDQMKARQAEAEREKLMKRSGMDKAQFDAFVQNLPEVAEAAEKDKKASELLKEIQAERARQAIAEHVTAIGKLDPAIKSLEDLAKTAEFPAIQKRVQNGMNLLDAYKLETWDKQISERNAAAQQAAVNRQRSKDHLRKTAERGAGEEPVPSDVMQMYRTLNPNATEAQIRAHYNKSQKNKRQTK